MIGKVYQSVVNFYDSKTKTTQRKGRPVLVVAGPRNNDYTVLPISTIPNRHNLDADFDVLIGPAERSMLKLPKECFVRTHKQTTLHAAELVTEKGDMKKDLEGLYLLVLQKMEEYQNIIMTQAL